MTVRLTRPLAAVALVVCMGSVAAAQNKPSIEMAEPNVDQGTILIYGQNFTANNQQTVVTLSGATLTLQTVQSTFIAALLPSGLLPGSYRLAVTRGNGTASSVSFEITIGAVGATGATGATGAQGPEGGQGDMGPQGDHRRRQRSRD